MLQANCGAKICIQDWLTRWLRVIFIIINHVASFSFFAPITAYRLETKLHVFDQRVVVKTIACKWKKRKYTCFPKCIAPEALNPTRKVVHITTRPGKNKQTKSNKSVKDDSIYSIRLSCRNVVLYLNVNHKSVCICIKVFLAMHSIWHIYILVVRLATTFKLDRIAIVNLVHIQSPVFHPARTPPLSAAPAPPWPAGKSLTMVPHLRQLERLAKLW
jgi:hypothetical protein